MNRRLARTAALALAVAAAAGCTVDGDSRNSVDEQVRILSHRYDCGHGGDDRTLKGALIYIPGRPDRVAVVPIGREQRYVGPLKYVHDSYCTKVPAP